MDCVRGPIPRKDQITNLPLDTGKTRGNRPAWTPLESTGQTESNIFSQSKESAVEEAARSEIVLLKPNRCQKTDMKDRGSNLDTRPSIPYRCDDCDTQMLTGHHSVMTGYGSGTGTDPDVPGEDGWCPNIRGECSVASYDLFGRSGNPIDGWVLEIG